MRLNKRGFPILSINRAENIIKYRSSRLNIKHFKDNRGVNSSIFLIHDPNKYFNNNIIKICNYEIGNSYNEKRVKRFEREIEALKKAKSNGCKNVIKIFHNDFIEIQEKKFPYYLMEKADYTLTDLVETQKLDISEKTRICIQILNGLKELHDLKMYHRDLKPDNILYIENEWKICDLGLIDFANADYLLQSIDEVGEKIGPFGWLSPEAMNKFFTEGKNLELDYDCIIDSKSDVYQLGKLFWYIFQANIPEGLLEGEDFIVGDGEIYEIIKNMLQHKKIRRPGLIKIQEQFEPVRKRLVA